MQVQDDLYLGPLGPNGFCLVPTAGENPTAQYGCGPMGRIAFLNIAPLTLQTANVAALQAPTSGTALALSAGTGATLGVAPDGSGASVIVFDVARAVSLTSAANLSGFNVLVTGFDVYGQKMTQLLAGPNANTVNTLKAFKSVLSVVPQGTSASTLSVGTSDVFGLPFAIADAGYIVSAKWDNTLAQNAGTFVAADATAPATNATGDVRGTFAQAGSASNGSRRLVIAMHLTAGQCGPSATQAGAIGVAQA